MDENMAAIKNAALAALASAGSILTNALGGWDAGLETLLAFMALDYATGLLVAGVFKRSGKSGDGALDSRSGFHGLCKKAAALLCVLVAARLDAFLGGEYARTAMMMFFVGNEGLSILENLGLMGVPLPPALKNALTALRDGKSAGGNGAK